MEKKLEALEEKYASLAERLESTEIMSDMAAYAKCMKEYKALTPIIDKYHEYKTALADLKDAEEIAAETDDAEMRALAQEQSAQSRLAIDRCLGELKLLLLPRDPNDDKNVIVEIRCGRGRGRGGAVRLRAVSDVYDVRRKMRLQNRAALCQRNRARRASRRSAS